MLLIITIRMLPLIAVFSSLPYCAVEHFRQYRSLFLVLAVCWCALASAPFLFWHSAAVHLFINSFHAPAADFVFSWITNLGDGWSVVPVVLILCVFSYKDSLTMASANILAGIVTQLLKRNLFSEMLRPSKFFEGIAVLHTVPGVQLYSFGSFPSGHAATVFTVCTVLALRTSSKTAHVFLLLVAVATAFSRVYLSQHFLHDVAAGSMIGILLGLGCERIATARANQLPPSHWLNRSLLPSTASR